jgi:hypothetical protein
MDIYMEEYFFNFKKNIIGDIYLQKKNNYQKKYYMLIGQVAENCIELLKRN